MVKVKNVVGRMSNPPNGFATLMRGKSPTAERSASQLFGSMTRVEDRRREGLVNGKSKTCRASEWQSQ
jgi:hypothetical protein